MNNELVMILNQNSMKVELGNTERDKLLIDMTRLIEHIHSPATYIYELIKTD